MHFQIMWKKCLRMWKIKILIKQDVEKMERNVETFLGCDKEFDEARIVIFGAFPKTTILEASLMII